ncbi:MAG: MmcQ/YjbR family DNA-binding protein [Tenacibaculum sp.]
MNIEQLYQYCNLKRGVTEEFPFDNQTLVFKVMGKIFALTSLETWEKGEAKINLKCDPEWAEELREKYSNSIKPGYHMNKKHWNTLSLNAEISDTFAFSLIDHSYNLIVKGLSKKLKEKLKKL